MDIAATMDGWHTMHSPRNSNMTRVSCTYQQAARELLLGALLALVLETCRLRTLMVVIQHHGEAEPRARYICR